MPLSTALLHLITGHLVSVCSSAPITLRPDPSSGAGGSSSRPASLHLQPRSFYSQTDTVLSCCAETPGMTALSPSLPEANGSLQLNRAQRGSLQQGTARHSADENTRFSPAPPLREAAESFPGALPGFIPSIPFCITQSKARA